jgi:HK97 family phage major capsid protein
MKVRKPAVERMNFILDRLQEIAGMEQPTAQQKRESDILMAEQATLRSALTQDELRASTIERLENLAGTSISPSLQLPERADREWRGFAMGQNERRYVRTSGFEIHTEKRAAEIDRERRAAQLAGSQTISWTNLAAGGAFVPWEYVDRQLASRKQYDGIFDNCLEILTDTGRPTSLPAIDDVENQSTQVSENTNSYGIVAPTINASVTQLGAFTFRAGAPIFVSLEALQDSGTPWPALLERAFAIRHARGVGQALITGAGGGNAPTGILTALNNLDLPEVIAGGANPNTGNAADTGANSIGSADLTQLFYSINSAYRANAQWFLNDSTLQTITEKTDKVGNPLVRYVEGIGGVLDAYIFGKRVVICPSMPSISPNAPTVIFGALKEFFAVRHCRSGEYIQRFDETAAEFGLVAFQSYTRVDSNLVVPNASYPPANFLIQHS